MSTAVTLPPVAELADDKNKEAGWDPYQVWKEQVGGEAREPLSQFPNTPHQDTWSPYQVWMQHVARKP